jgi:hypothetical protein
MFAATGWGTQGDVFIGGVVNGLSGPTGMAEYNQAGTAPDYGDVTPSGSNGEVGGLINGPMGATEPFQSGHQKRADEKTRMDTQRKQWGAESAAKRAAEKQAIKDRDNEIYRQHREAEDPRIEPTGSSSTLADLAPKPPIEADKEFGPLSENFDAGGSP